MAGKSGKLLTYRHLQGRCPCRSPAKPWRRDPQKSSRQQRQPAAYLERLYRRSLGRRTNLSDLVPVFWIMMKMLSYNTREEQERKRSLNQSWCLDVTRRHKTRGYFVWDLVVTPNRDRCGISSGGEVRIAEVIEQRHRAGSQPRGVETRIWADATGTAAQGCRA